MHYYAFDIGDYRRDTAHLKPMEHYIYRSLIDWYFLDEKPIPKKTQLVMRRLNLDTQPETESMLLAVLDDFFDEMDDGWHQKRIDQTIADYHAKAVINKENGKKGGRPSKKQPNETQTEPEITQSVNSANPSESELNPNQEPITNNHNKTLSLIAGELEKSDLPKTPEHQTYGQALTPQQIIDLWQPDQELLAEHLKFALAQPVTLEFLNKILVKFNAQYEHQVLSENKKHSKLAGWIKDEQAKQASTRTGRTKTQSQKPDRVIHGSFGKIGESSTKIRDVSPVGVGYEHE